MRSGASAAAGFFMVEFFGAITNRSNIALQLVRTCVTNETLQLVDESMSKWECLSPIVSLVLLICLGMVIVRGQQTVIDE